MTISRQAFVNRVTHTHDPETSEEAAETVYDHLTDIQSEVLSAFCIAGAKGLTDFELAARFPNCSYSTYRTRRCELRDKGHIVDSGQRKTLKGNRRHVVWVLATFAKDQ
jgi:hypothetical protein